LFGKYLSPLAEGILASKLPATKFTVDSAGTEIGTFHADARSIAAAKNHNLDISNQKHVNSPLLIS
jgi:protein-tyrosine phosphatase